MCHIDHVLHVVGRDGKQLDDIQRRLRVVFLDADFAGGGDFDLIVERNRRQLDFVNARECGRVYLHGVHASGLLHA